MMKRVLAVLLFVMGTIPAFAQRETVILDTAINQSMTYLAGRLTRGAKVVVLNFDAPTGELSDYVIEELTAYIVNDGSLAVVDRRNLELLQQEMNFQMSGEVSDATAQAIGRKLGAQIIISGSITRLSDNYRMRIQAIEVETAQILGVQTVTVEPDATLAALLQIEYKGPKAQPARASREENNSASNQGFSAGRKIGAGILNIAFGIGSFSMGDWGGGLTILGGYAAAGGLVAVELGVLSYDDDLVTIPGNIGIGVAGVSVLYGFIRPFLYQRKVSTVLLNVLDGVNVAVFPDSTGVRAVRLTYTHSF
jgi:TolB-like protein